MALQAFSLIITSAVDLGYITVFDFTRDTSGFFNLSRNFQSYGVITIATKELQI